MAPSCIQSGVAHVEASLAPSVEHPLFTPVLTPDGTVDFCPDDIVDFDDSELKQCSCMYDILDFRNPRTPLPPFHSSTRDALRYSAEAVDQVLHCSMSTHSPYHEALSLLGVLLQEPDFFAYHVIPAKNLLAPLSAELAYLRRFPLPKARGSEIAVGVSSVRSSHVAGDTCHAFDDLGQNMLVE
ncbi:hypothetical protein FOZ61_000227, partial [Perkinsus olseni]